MFRFMEKYRIPILLVVLVGLFGFGAWFAIESLFSDSGRENMLLGTMAIPGAKEKVEIRSDRVRNIDRHMGMLGRPGFPGHRGIAMQFGLSKDAADKNLIILDFIALAEAARAAGVVPAEDAVANTIRDFFRMPEDADLGRVAEETYDFFRDFLAASAFRSQYMTDPAGPTFDELFNEYKRNNVVLEGRYVVFEKKPAESFELDVTKEEDRKKLEEFFDQNPIVKSQNRIPEKIELEVVYTRLKEKSVPEFAAAFDEKWAELTKEIEVKPEDVQARFNASRATYEVMAKDERARRAKDEPKDEKPEEGAQEPTDVEILTPHLEREIKVARLLKKVRDEAGDDPSRLAELAEQKGFSVAKLDSAERNALATHPDFGSFRLSNLVWTEGVEKLAPPDTEPGEDHYALGKVIEDPTQATAGHEAGIFDDPGRTLALVRVTARSDARDPTFSEVVAKVKTEWQKRQVQDDLRTAAEDFKDAVNAAILALPELAEKVKEAETKRDENVKKALEEQKLDESKEEDKLRIDAIKKSYEQAMLAELAEDMKPHYAAAFEKVAGEKGLEIRKIGPINKRDALNPTFSDDLSETERLNRSLRSMQVLNALAFLEPGQMTYPSPNFQSGLSFMMVLDKKVEPAPAEMLGHQARLKEQFRNRKQQPDRNWGFDAFKSPEFFSLDAPEVSRHLEETRQKEAAAEERKRQREEARRREAEERMKAQLPANPPDEAIPPKEDTTPPKEDATRPKEDTPPPKESTPAPKESTPAPKESTPAPKESTPDPKEGTPPPKEEPAPDPDK